MNQVVLIGRLVKDPLIMGQKQPVVKARLATRIGYNIRKHNDEVVFVPVTIFSLSNAQIERLKKGTRIGVIGVVKESSYKKGNDVVYTTDVIVRKENVTFL